MAIARIVWDLGQATVRQVHEALPPSRHWDYTTVQTYLARLEAKGYLKFKLINRSKIYSAKVRPTRVIGDAVEEFVTALFGGESIPLIRHLLTQRDISEAELSELRRLVNEAQESPDD